MHHRETVNDCKLLQKLRLASRQTLHYIKMIYYAARGFQTVIVRAAGRTWSQLLHPSFRKVALTAFLAALATLLVLTGVLTYIWPDSFNTGIGWVDDALIWADEAALGLTAVISWYLLFPALVTTVMSLFVDQIALAVETDYYPARKGLRQIPMSEALWNGIKFAGIVILLNILALVPYLILLFLGGIGAPILFLFLNGYLLGREYFEMVATRHMPIREATYLRRRAASTVLLTGAAMALMFLVPVINLISPIIGAAMMTHIFHAQIDKYGFPSSRDDRRQTKGHDEGE